MPKDTIGFSIDYLSILDEVGRADSKLMPDLTEHDIRSLYESMVLARVIDDRILKLQREGRCGTYASSLGQEASQAGSAYALLERDWMFPYFRDAGSMVVRKFPLSSYVLYWMGDERGMKIPDSQNNFMVCIPVSTQVLHAVGAAFALKMQKKNAVVMVYMGDGATSKGDFHEGLNFAGVFNLPVVFVVENNQYAISVPVSRQTASKTLAQKAIAYGIDGVKVDGNDVFAMFAAAKAAIEKARSGKGPTLIESYTYRVGDHTTSDDASRYRSKDEVEAWKKKDPIERLRKYMESKGLWTQDYEAFVTKDAAEKAETAIKQAESVKDQPLEDLFGFMYDKMPEKLKEQLNEAKGESL